MSWDVFYSGNDREIVAGRYNQVTAADVSWVLRPEGVLVNTGAGSNGFALGRLVLIQQSAKPDAYAIVAKKLSNTQVFLLPLRTTADGAGAVGTTYGNTATITSGLVAGVGAYETLATMVVDLTDAPELSYKYLVLGDAGAAQTGANRQTRVLLRSEALVDDPLSGNGVGEAVFDCGPNNAFERWGFHVVKEVTLTGGQRYEFHLQVVNGSTANRGNLRNGHLLAVRVDGWPGYTRSTSNADAVASNAPNTTDVTHASVVAPSTSTFVAFVCGLVGHSSATAADRVAEVKVKVAAAVVRSARPVLNATTSRLPVAFIGAIGPASGNVVALTVNNQGASGNAFLEKGIVAIASLASLPPWFAARFNDSQAAASVTAPTEFTDAINSAGQTIAEGMHIEIISTGVGLASGTLASDVPQIRPVWHGDYYPDQVQGTPPLEYENDATPRGALGHFQHSATNQPNSMGFFLWRGWRRATAGSVNTVQAKCMVSSHNVYVGATSFLWLREVEPPSAGPERAIVTAVDMERAVISKGWELTGTTGLFQLRLPHVLRCGRGNLNGADLPQAAVQSSAPKLTTPGTWGWDKVARIAYLYMPATPAGRSPSDDRETFVLAVEEFVAPRAVLLTDGDGDIRPYLPELEKAPEVSTELQVRSSGTEAATSIGDLQLTNMHAQWDDVSMRENFVGMYGTIRRGLRSSGALSGTLLRTLQTVAKATLDLPEISQRGETFSVGLYDRALQLKRPLSDSRVTVYEGLAAGSGPRDFVPLNILYGMKLRRVPALRVSSDFATPTEHWFKVCQHSVVAFGNVYADASTTTPIATGYVPTAADLLCGQFRFDNAAGGGDDDVFKQDVVYVDVLGGIGGGIENAGLIAEHLLTNFPLRVDEYAGAPATTIASATHTSAYAGANCQVASTANFQVGDQVLVVSNAAATTYYHAIVTAILAGPARLTLVPKYETGDAVVGSAFTAGASSVVRKTVFAGGLALTDLARASFRLFDRLYRQQFTGGAYIPAPPAINLVLDTGTATVDEAVAQLMRTFGYFLANPLGRVEIGVVDDAAATLARNGGFEFDLVTAPASSRSFYPWQANGFLSAQITTGLKASGQQCIEIGRTALQQWAELAQDVTIARGGEFVAPTVLVGLRSGDGSAVRLAFSGPQGELRDALSDPFPVESAAWTRVSHPFPVPRGASGRARVKVVPHYPEGIAPVPSVLGSSFLGLLVPSARVTGWLRAHQVAGQGGTLPQNGSRTGTWTGLKGSDNATASGGARPRWWKNACYHQPGLVFDDTDFMQWIAVAGAPYTIFAVYSVSDMSSATGHRALSGGSADWFMGPHVGGGSTYLFHAFTGGSGGATAGYVGAGLAIDESDTFAVCCLVASSSSLSEHYVNGASVGQNTATSQVAPGTIFLGKGGSVAQSLMGRMVEVIALNFAMTSAADRTAVFEYLMRTYGVRATTLAVDDFRVFPVCAVLTKNNSEPFPLEFDPDTFFEAQVSFGANTQEPEVASFVRVTDSEARGLTTAISQAKNALPNAQRLIVDDLLVTDAQSAAGIAAAYAAYFSRPRHRLSIRWLAPTRIPKVGERVFHRDNRVPELSDRNPIHLLVGVTTGEDNVVDLKTERQNDFVSDRLTIAASDFPIGLTFMTVSSSCPGSGYSEEVVGMRGFYLVGGATADLSGFVGSPVHRHQCDHVHVLSSHSHSFAIPIQTLGDPDAIDDIDLGASFVGPHVFKNVSRGKNDSGGPHVHTVGSSITGQPTNAVSIPSDNPTSTLFTFYGGNDVTWIRVLFCKRVGGSGTFPTDMILGYVGGAAAPPSWNLCDGGGGRPDFRLRAPRGARTDVDGTDTTIKTGTSHTQTNAVAGGNMDLTVPTQVRLFARVTVTGGGNTFHGVVVREPGSDGLAADRCKVQSLHEDNDAPDGTVYPAGSTVAIDDERPGVSVSIGQHRHQKTGNTGTAAIPDHQHQAKHRHTSQNIILLPGASGFVNAEVVVTIGTGPLSLDLHAHTVIPVLPEETGASGSAGGDITSSTVNAPDRYAMPFIMPDSGQSVLPASVVAFSDTTCPDGFELHEPADGLLIVGAGAGLGPGAIVAGHVHSVSFAAHSFTHNHGGSGTATVDPDVAASYDLAVIPNPTGRKGTTAWDPSFGPWFAGNGHVHTVVFNAIQNTAATLGSTTGNTASSKGVDSIPPARTMLPCRKT